MHSALISAVALAGAVAALPTQSQDLEARANGTGVQFVGTNIAGFDFGCSTKGECVLAKAEPPISNLGGADGPAQMNHFSKDLGMNMFRLPVGWQWLVNGKIGGTLDPGNTQKYDGLMQACLKTGAYCVIDIHNYARWNGQIIGQGGPPDDQFVSLWKQLATKYASNPKIVFGLMNEPHDVPDIDKWVDTCQAVVTAIRAVAKTHLILLPGNDWTSAKMMPTKSGPALLKVKNPDGSTDGLIIDVHKYLDTDNSGTHTECVTDNVSESFDPLAKWLRDNKRQALATETGGGNTDSCKKFFCSQLSFMNKNSDVFLGYLGWSAGGFVPGYELSEVPTKNGNSWTDTSLVKACLAKRPM